jgi:hypothetical protein
MSIEKQRVLVWLGVLSAWQPVPVAVLRPTG